MTENKDKPEVKTETEPEEEFRPELVDEFEDLNVDDLVPTMNVKDIVEPEEPPCIVTDDDVTELYDEILDNCRKDRDSAEEVY